MKAKDNHRNSAFQQGYACAVCALIQMDGQVETGTRELFSAGLGEYNIKKFRKWGIDEFDISILKKHRKELI